MKIPNTFFINFIKLRKNPQMAPLMAIYYQNYEMSWFFWYSSLLVPSVGFWENLNQTFLFWQKLEKKQHFHFFLCFIYALVYICLHKVDIICINPYLSFLSLIYTFFHNFVRIYHILGLRKFLWFLQKNFFWPILITYI